MDGPRLGEYRLVPLKLLIMLTQTICRKSNTPFITGPNSIPPQYEFSRVIGWTFFFFLVVLKVSTRADRCVKIASPTSDLEKHTFLWSLNIYSFLGHFS